jgi:hypothetical protein
VYGEGGAVDTEDDEEEDDDTADLDDAPVCSPWS